MKIKITIRHLSSNYTLEINTSDTLEHLKYKIYLILNIDPTLQVLLYNDRQLTENHRNLNELEIDDNSVIFLKKKNQVKVLPKPSKNKSMLDMLNNPDYMKNMMEMMPQMKEEMEDNPQLKAMMNNPSFQEEMLNLSGDPNYLKEQMKNFDLTVSKLENMPGGFNMINSMMKDVQDPLVSAFTNNLGSSKFKEGEKINKTILEPIPGSKKGISQIIKYKEELALLRAMGFDNSKKNLSALVACNGNVDETIEHLKNRNKGC